jgi:hypothetical protein
MKYMGSCPLNWKFLVRESLVSDIPAGDGKIANLFYSVDFREYNKNVDELKEGRKKKPLWGNSEITALTVIFVIEIP